MIVTIHQPNFMPWYPFFQKMAQADVFVILAHCQYEKNGFQNRFNHQGIWKTLSINKGLQPIVEKQYIDSARDWTKIKNTTPDFLPHLEIFDDCITDSLVETNVNIIKTAAKKLGISTEIVLDKPTDLTGTNRLVQICKDYGASEYVSGMSGKKYLDLSCFSDNKIKLTFQEEDGMIKKSLIEKLEDNNV
jgi:hypothetical protein